jgi:hypothetical protein
MLKRTKLVIAGISAALVMGGGAAYAAVTQGPTPTQGPGSGPYYPAGYLNVCINQTTEAVRVELHTDVLGNCGANEVQATLQVLPSEATSPAGS